MNSSPRRASMAATTSRGLHRTGNATRSRLVTPTIGTRRAWAIALAAAMPTRRPVNRPGPTSTATQPISSRSMRACWRRKSIDGASDSAWRLPRLEWIEAEHALVAADGAPDLHGRGGDAEDQHGAASGPSPAAPARGRSAGVSAGARPTGRGRAAARPAGAPTRADRAQLDAAVVVGASAPKRSQAHLEVVVRQHRAGWRRPTRSAPPPRRRAARPGPARPPRRAGRAGRRRGGA